MSIYGILFACPVCPSASAFGFTRLTLWGFALILSSVLLLAPSRYARAQAAALCALLFPMAWFLTHQAVNGWCPPCLLWWAFALGMLVSRMPALERVERVVAAIAAAAILASAGWTAHDPRLKGFAARLVQRQENRIASLRDLLKSPPGLKEGADAPPVMREYENRVVVALADCPPCVASSVAQFLSQLPDAAEPVILIPRGRREEIKSEPFARYAIEVDPPVFSALNLDSNAPPFVFRFEGGKVLFSKPLSASQSLLEQYPAEQPTDLGARAESSARAQSSKNPNKEETKK